MKKRDIWISVAIIGVAVLALLSYSRGKGSIKIDAGSAIAELQIRSNWFSNTKITSAAGPTAVSAQVHRPRRLSISTGQGSSAVRLNSVGPWGDLSRIKVQNDTLTSLEFGPPLLIEPNVQRDGSRVSIGLSIIGQAGEHYQHVRRGPGPQVRIVDETGKVLSKGRFAYG